MITEHLEKFREDFREKIKEKDHWGEWEIEEVFESHYTKLLMNMLKATLHERKINA